jgi:hypothetical protein
MRFSWTEWPGPMMVPFHFSIDLPHPHQPPVRRPDHRKSRPQQARPPRKLETQLPELVGVDFSGGLVDAREVDAGEEGDFGGHVGVVGPAADRELANWKHNYTLETVLVELRRCGPVSSERATELACPLAVMKGKRRAGGTWSKSVKGGD